MAKERVQKILAKAGIASRRKAEELITLGEVTINGQVAKLGDQAEWGVDAVKVGGKLITATEQPVYIAFYKPKNVICAMEDPQGRPALAPYFVRVLARIYPIGRLDFTSEGLVLLTNDGAITEKIAKSRDLVRVYSVKVKGNTDAEMLKRIQRGMKGEQGEIRPEVARIEEKLENKTKIQVVLRGSQSADLRHLFETRGFLVERMMRTAIGQVTLHGMKPGEYRRLEASQFKAIIEQPELGLREIKSDVEKDAADAQRRDDRAARREAVVEVESASTGARRRVSSGIGKKTGKTVFQAKKFYMDEAGGEDRPARKPSFGDRKPRGSFGDKPSFGDSKPRGGFGGGDRKGAFGDRKPRGSFGDRPSFGDSKPRGGFGGGDRKGAFGDRKPRGSFGDKPSFGDSKPRGGFGGGDRKGAFGDRKPRGGFSKKPRGRT